MVGVWSIDHESRTPLADILQNLADDYYITLTNSDKHELERKHTLETICEYLTAKLHERKPNDGMVQYGTTYGGSRQEQERQDFEDRWGGSICVPTGLPMKHVSDLFNALGTSMGIMDEVPVEDRVGPLKNAQAPIRIWVRTAPAEVAQGTFGLGAAVKERQYYQAHPESPHMDYLDHDAMLDDGWVVD